MFFVFSLNHNPETSGLKFQVDAMLRFRSKKNLLIHFILFFLVCLFVFERHASAEIMDKNEQAFKKAATFTGNGELKKALNMYYEISENTGDPEIRARALLFAGMIHGARLENTDNALKVFGRILADMPETVSARDALFSSGVILAETGRLNEAEAVFVRYIKCYPEGMRKKSAQDWIDFIRTSYPSQTSETFFENDYGFEDEAVRVLIRKNSTRITVFSEGGLAVQRTESGGLVLDSASGITVTRHGGFLSFNGKKTGLKKCIIRGKGKMQTVCGKGYRGDIAVISEPEGGMSVINHLPVEQYLYGVVPEEVPPSWDEQALKAQAVAARTYALFMKQKNRNALYDLTATTESQVYGGIDAESVKTTQAVDMTKGEIIKHKGSLILACFHSSSGGYTEDPLNVWGFACPYLQSHHDEYNNEPHGGGWEYFAEYDSIVKRLNRYGVKVKKINKLTAGKTSGSRRVQRVCIESSESGSVIVSANDFRRAMGADKVRSTLFTVKAYPNGILFQGKGYGHGVGMSQDGARLMAEKGYSYKDILSYYYRGTTVANMNVRNALNLGESRKGSGGDAGKDPGPQS